MRSFVLEWPSLTLGEGKWPDNSSGSVKGRVGRKNRGLWRALGSQGRRKSYRTSPVSASRGPGGPRARSEGGEARDEMLRWARVPAPCDWDREAGGWCGLLPGSQLPPSRMARLTSSQAAVTCQSSPVTSPSASVRASVSLSVRGSIVSSVWGRVWPASQERN